MLNQFFEQPILNSPYLKPTRHWELDETGQYTQRIIESRRKVSFITPIPKPKKRIKTQQELLFDEGIGSTDKFQKSSTSTLINGTSVDVEDGRNRPNAEKWDVTPKMPRFLKHWRHHQFCGVRSFFCQVDGVETAVGLTEVAPHLCKKGKGILHYLKRANDEASPEITRFALKLATGAGKTTVMTMFIVWQIINAVRRLERRTFTHGFLVVPPGITIKAPCFFSEKAVSPFKCLKLKDKLFRA